MRKMTLFFSESKQQFYTLSINLVAINSLMIDWNIVKNDFAWDGSLRDITIAPASMDDWAAIWQLIRQQPGAEFSFEGQSVPAPAQVQEVFKMRASGSPLLRLRVGSVLIAFHFFSPEEIECDVDPRDIKSQVELDALLSFVRKMGDATAKRVFIHPENLPEHVLISYDPQTKNFDRAQPEA